MIILGSTGSIGVNTIKVALKFGLNVETLVAGTNIKLLNEQIKLVNPKRVVIANKEDIHKVHHKNVSFGENAICEAIEKSDSNLVVNALVGFLGLKPTLKACECKKKLALANKESLVVAGEFIDQTNLVPIDSEHFALWYLLSNKQVDSMTITASGGAFLNYPLEKLKNASVQGALNHPNWSMGNKITIDSATMTNKLFELLEAKWIFNTSNLDAIIEQKSLIHGLINYKDGSTTAHIANANMTLPIAYAIAQDVNQEILKPVNLLEIGSLEFKKIENSRYPIWQIKDLILQNPHLGVVLNAANEVAVQKFLNSQIGFLDISEISLKAIEKFSHMKVKNLDDIFLFDTEVRGFANEF